MASWQLAQNVVAPRSVVTGNDEDDRKIRAAQVILGVDQINPELGNEGFVFGFPYLVPDLAAA